MHSGLSEANHVIHKVLEADVPPEKLLAASLIIHTMITVGSKGHRQVMDIFDEVIEREMEK